MVAGTLCNFQFKDSKKSGMEGWGGGGGGGFTTGSCAHVNVCKFSHCMLQIDGITYYRKYVSHSACVWSAALGKKKKRICHTTPGREYVLLVVENGV